MLEGTVRLVLLLESETEVPPEGAVPFRETMQELVPGVLTVKGLQLSALIGTDRVMVPEAPLEGMEVPAAVDVTTAVICMGIVWLDASADIWKVALATIPSGITVPFSAATTQRSPMQDNDF